MTAESILHRGKMGLQCDGRGIDDAMHEIGC
jgi:hypothetical protein